MARKKAGEDDAQPNPAQKPIATRTKVIVSNYGPSAREMLIVKMDAQGGPRLDKVLRRRMMLSCSTEQADLEPDEALLVKPISRRKTV